MSAHTRCNRCQLERIEARAKQSGYVVTLRPSTTHDSGVDVLVHPKLDAPDSDKHFVAWFLTLSAGCVCVD